MNSLLFLMVGAGVVVLVAVKNNTEVHSLLKKHSKKVGYLPKAISMLAITAQIPELAKVLEHVSLIHVATSLFLLAILVATKSGTESELH
jgi:hypothetical protein